MAKKKYKAKDLIGALRTRFSDRQRYSVFEQVANGTGWSARSWVDFMVLYLWPSDGLNRAAFEIKVSRQDFLKELQNPTKNEWARQVCNEFWFVAPKDVIKEEELPEGVGWMRPHGDKLAIVRHAARTEGELTPEFVASLARSMHKAEKKNDREIRERVLAESVDYKIALAYKAAVDIFLTKHKRSVWRTEDKPEEIVKELEAVITTDKVERSVEHIRKMVGRYQRALVDIVEVMLPAAYVGMLETDELGKFIVKEYGSEDALTLAQHRAIFEKPKGKHDYRRGQSEMIIRAFDGIKRIMEEREGDGSSAD